MATSWNVYVDTIKSLSKSQGYYSRLWDWLQGMNEEELSAREAYINEHCNFTDPIDVILALES